MIILIRLLLWTALLLPVSTTLARGETPGPEPSIPTQQFLEAQLKKAHPRLLVTGADFARVKKLIREEDAARRWYARLRQESQEIMKEQPCRYRLTGSEGMLLDVSRAVLRRVYVLSLLQQVEGGNRYGQRLWQELEAAARFPDWNPIHFLDTGEMTHAFAVAYDWLYDYWSPEQRAVLANAIRDKGLAPALKAYRGEEKYGWWVKNAYNWNLVCNGGLGLGALAVLDDFPEPAAAVLQEALKSLPRALAKFAPDGACYEGPLYWGYATYYTTLFVSALESAVGRSFGLANAPGFGATGFFPLYVTGPRDLTFNFADADEHIHWSAQLFWLARKFQQPVLAWAAHRLMRRVHPLDLLWFESGNPSPRQAGLPLDRYFRGVEVATFRSHWDDPQALFVGFKGGDNQAGHAHLDLGSFVLDAQGVRWALDLGGDDYDLPGYFDKSRWDYYRLRAEGHNTLAINPGAGPDQDPKATAAIIRFRAEPDRALAVADLTPAYQGQAQRVWRGLALLNRQQVLVQDEIQAEKPAEVWWAMHTPADVVLSEDQKTAHLSQGKARFEARILAPAEAVFTLLPPRPLPLSPHPPRQAANQGVSKLAIHLDKVKDLSLRVLLQPLPGEEGKGPSAAAGQAVPLSQW